jgi:hypothetical protein
MTPSYGICSCRTTHDAFALGHRAIWYHQKMVFCIIFFVSSFVFLLCGFVWQALDMEEFPSEDLSAWFVQRVRKPLVALLQRCGVSFRPSTLCALQDPKMGELYRLLRLFARGPGPSSENCAKRYESLTGHTGQKDEDEGQTSHLAEDIGKATQGR